jgi:drug/metabolite transporter (DMT)-like permease
LPALRPKSPRRHLERTFWGLLGMAGAFYGYAHLPLATVTALGFTMPLFLTALSVPLLGERVGWRRWSAVLVGFAGVLVMMRPGAGEAPLHMPAVALVLAGSVGWAMAMISIRRMGEAGESGVAIVIWFALGASAVSALFAVPGWVAPDATQWALLIVTGLVSAVAQLLMTEAYRRGETTLLAPFEYFAIVWTMAMGAAIWGEWPAAWDFLGVAILVGAGLFIWHREVRLGVRR